MKWANWVIFFSKYSLIQLERRYSICGGVARPVYSLDTEHELKKDIIRAIIGSDLDKLRKFVDSEGNATIDAISYMLFSLGVDHTLQTIRPVFASQFIIEQLNYSIKVQNDLKRFDAQVKKLFTLWLSHTVQWFSPAKDLFSFFKFITLWLNS